MKNWSLASLLVHETCCWELGENTVAGVDEAGRGPLAGPVVAAAVILPPDRERLAALQGLTDSKQLSPHHRDRLFPVICRVARAVGVGMVTVPVIDRINIRQASFLAMRRALACLDSVERVLVDGPWLIPQIQTPQQPLVRGDSRSLSIAAASVMAKVLRDRIMVKLAEQYPTYAWAENKGYPTLAHRQAITRQGLCPQHRLTFCGKYLVAANE